MLQHLKSIQTDLERDMEGQAQVLEDVSIKRQRLESLLEDNLLKRKRELEEEGAAELSGHRRRSKAGEGQPSKMAQAQRVEDLERVKEELDEAVRTSDEVESKLIDAKRIDTDLRAELIAAKKESEMLRLKDQE